MTDDLIQICAVSGDDIEQISEWYNSREHTRRNGIPYLLVSNELLKRQIIDRYIMTKDPNLIIKAGERKLGLIYHEVSKPMMSGAAISLYIFLEREYEAFFLKGIAAYLEYVFSSVCYARVTLYISQLVLEKNKNLHTHLIQQGFIEEGVLKEERYIEGKYINTHIFGIMREDFQCD